MKNGACAVATAAVVCCVLMIPGMGLAGTQVDIGPAPGYRADLVASADNEDGLIDRVMAGMPAFGFDLDPRYNLVNFPDTDAPGSWTVIANLPDNAYYAGDFINGDFSTLYVIDGGLNELHALDTATGARQVIASCQPLAGETWTGMSASMDGVMYASSTSISRSTLYTLNLSTGAVTVVGEITNAPAVIDIAISPGQVMYGVDISNEMLVRIDPQTAAGTIVGYIGFDANYAQGMDFEEESGVLYLAAYNSSVGSGELRTANLDNGTTTLIGAFPDGAEVDAFAFASGGQSSCDNDTDCDDGLYCNGAETCDNGTCVASVDPCDNSTLFCNEDTDSCVECLSDDNCTGGMPLCDPVDNICVECVTDSDCSDNLTCTDGACFFPCALSIKYKEIKSAKLSKPRKRAFFITGGEDFDPYGTINFEPFEIIKSKVKDRKQILKIKAIVPEGLEPGWFSVSVGNCSGEIEITGTTPQ